MLELTPDGKVVLRLRRTWRDGTRAIRFEPTEPLEKLAAMIPKPRINLLVYHGVFAPHARRRRGAVGTSAGPVRRRPPECGSLHPPQGSGGRVWSAGHLDLPVDAPRAAPARVSGLLPGFEITAD